MEIQIRNLLKTFNRGEKTAVNNVSFDVHDGEFLLLVGLEDVTSGEIRFGDRVVNEIRPKGRNVAMVFQDYAVFPHMTVFENIAYGLRSRGGMPRAEITKRVN